MSQARSNDKHHWQHYKSVLEEFALTRDLEEVMTEFWKIVNSSNPVPSISLLTEITNHFIKFKQYEDAKRLFGRILQQDENHRDTWKALSSLYFKLKDNKKAEFCLEKYYSLRGGNTQLKTTIKDRLSSSGRLKILPTNQSLGLQQATQLQEKAPTSIMTTEEFTKRFNLSSSSLPVVIKRII